MDKQQNELIKSYFRTRKISHDNNDDGINGYQQYEAYFLRKGLSVSEIIEKNIFLDDRDRANYINKQN